MAFLNWPWILGVLAIILGVSTSNLSQFSSFIDDLMVSIKTEHGYKELWALLRADLLSIIDYLLSRKFS